MISSRMPRLRASASASVSDAGALYIDGMAMPVTFSGPSAAAAIHATSAESTPPLRPITTWRNPHLRV